MCPAKAGEFFFTDNRENIHRRMKKICLVHGPFDGDYCPRAWRECAEGKPEQKYIDMLLKPLQNGAKKTSEQQKHVKR